MMDLDHIKSVSSAEVEITHPVTGAGLGAFFTLASPDHPERKRAVAESSRRLREAGEGQGPELLDELVASAVAASVLGWRGVKANGEELAYSEAAARELLCKPEMSWLRGQLSRQLARQENFIETSAPA